MTHAVIYAILKGLVQPIHLLALSLFPNIRAGTLVLPDPWILQTGERMNEILVRKKSRAPEAVESSAYVMEIAAVQSRVGRNFRGWQMRGVRGWPAEAEPRVGHTALDEVALDTFSLTTNHIYILQDVSRAELVILSPVMSQGSPCRCIKTSLMSDSNLTNIY